MNNGLWRGVWHGCYRDSRLMTGAVALMLQVHRTRKTWDHAVDGYISLSHFARGKFIEGGLPASLLHVKPNFLESDPGERLSPGRSTLFVGRLSKEKGVDLLLKAWARLAYPVPLMVVGDGPLRPALEAEAVRRGLSNITFVGWRSRREIFEALKSTFFLIVPSLCYEGFPLTLVEAFACGTPVVASSLGSLGEIVREGHNGLHFLPGDEADLVRKVEWALSHPSELIALGHGARRDFEVFYTPEANYRILLKIYEEAIAHASRN